MNALFVTPVEQGSGETITAFHMAEVLAAKGHGILFLASPFASAFIGARFPDQVWPLGEDASLNYQTWERALQGFKPDVIVFADYPLMTLPSGVAPLAAEPGWLESLEAADACLVTLDHFGFAQHEMGLYFGPAHLSFQYHTFPAIPERMKILLPCPMHEPGPVEGRRGAPFRYWNVPLGVPAAVRQETRQRYLEDVGDFLVFHSIPNWAWQAADTFCLPFYDFLPQILDEYFGSTVKPVTIVSVNNGSHLSTPPGSKIRIINLGPIPSLEFEALLFSSDLVVTENKVSISMGKAICGLQPCAALINTYGILELTDRLEGRLREVVFGMERVKLGSVYKYQVFPSGMVDMLEDIILYKGNSLTQAFCEVEVYGGNETSRLLHRLLEDPQTRDTLRDQQQAYVNKVQMLPDAEEVLRSVVEEDRRLH
jgi:Family of unknown function (DUF6365)